MVAARTPILRYRLALTTLEARAVPSAAIADDLHPRRLAVGSGAGQAAQVSVYDADTNALLTTITPFGRGFTGGVRVAAGDVTGDGIDDVVMAAGAGSARVQVADGATGKIIADFVAFSGRAGAYVAVGDATGDDRADLVVGTGEGLRGQVKIYIGAALAAPTPVAAACFFALGAGFTGGVRVAVADVTGDGRADIITTAGAGTAVGVTVYAARSGVGLRYDATSFAVGGAGDAGGAFVAAADFDGDGTADIAVGRVVGTSARVSVFRGGAVRTRLFDAVGFTPSAAGGVPVAFRDLNGDGRPVLLAGTGNVSQIRAFAASGGLARSFMAYAPAYRGGIFVG